ncbi:MAG: glycosyltransferase family 4 protein [Deltaproteobacteria bacterium]|nr:glycosyltransferase family 4 protein [Deltaproteobacteria bacterium]
MRGLTAAGLFEVHLLTYNPDPAKAEASVPNRDGIYVHGHCHEQGEREHAYMYVMSAVKRLAELQNKYGYRLLIAFYAHMPAMIVSTVASCSHIPFIVCARGSDINVKMLDPLHRTMIQKYIRGAYSIIAVSESLAHSIRRFNVLPDNASIVRVNNSVDSDEYNIAVERKQVSNNRYDFAFIGNARPQKRFDLLVEAMARLKAQGVTPRVAAVLLPHVRFPHLAEQWRSMAFDKGIGDQIDFIGPMDRAGIVALFGDAKSIVVASDKEGFSNVILEAMASGCYVVARETAVDPLIAPHAYVFQDLDALVEAMKTIINIKRTYSIENVEFIRENFCTERETEAYKDIFYQAIRSKGVGSGQTQ